MGMGLELNTMIVTKGRESRLEENTFELVKEGYRLYPMEIPIEVKRTRDGETNGVGEIKRLQWENGETVITYQLISLNSTN
ncbi:DUF2584 domain-containing protein [Rossellomorea vietnamensis]|uniref:DUF2584 domain-containing protein n=1 Tax=Rossellomorea vietnamensis TaxID=218284 RepID=A0A5D4M8R2_9BACI|nr:MULTISPECIES: DUF2584 domain-containing protein [Bacillaceae]TYR98324.1 DUF2584 domain-containing protein [Rossellomorea vietnamensis]